MGTIILLLFITLEIGLLIYRIVTKSYQTKKNKIIGIGTFALFTLLAITGIIHFSFQWFMLYIILFMKALTGAWYLVLKKQRKVKTFQKRSVIMKAIGNSLLIVLAITPLILFPPFKSIKTTGTYEVKTASFTLTDQDRIETFTDLGENRKVTIQFWYPSNGDERYPLAVFSHGAFGFRGSNASTFEELASNGYVVCSIDHTYHSFFTKQTDGKVVITDMDFLNDAVAVQNGAYDEQKTYELSREWLKLRAGDVNFVLDDILKKVNMPDADPIYQMINKDRIGLFGHSMGGATAAWIGRERSDIDAVVVVDGTMFGEEMGFDQGQAVLNTTPYPVPLLNLYNESHYAEAKALGNQYPNTAAYDNAADARQIVIHKSGHLNFTDLPLFSPILAATLGTGNVNSRYCIETMNQIILDYFNYYLKDSQELNLKQEY